MNKVIPMELEYSYRLGTLLGAIRGALEGGKLDPITRRNLARTLAEEERRNATRNYILGLTD